MSAHRVSNFVVASWTARLATAIALAIGLIFAALVANAAPLTIHPRLWITADDLPKLRGWAVNTNPMYKNGLSVAASIAKADVDAKWNWAGLPRRNPAGDAHCRL